MDVMNEVKEKPKYVHADVGKLGVVKLQREVNNNIQTNLIYDHLIDIAVRMKKILSSQLKEDLENENE